MKITYNQYPLLLYTSYNQKNTPNELIMGSVNEKTMQKALNHKGYNHFLPLIITLNSKDHQAVNYFLSEKIQNRILNEENFRYYFLGKFSKKRNTQYGCILMESDYTCVYICLSKNDTAHFKGIDGSYIGVGHYKKNILIGFEEGIILDDSLTLKENGIYPSKTNLLDYLTFCIATLGYAVNNSNPLDIPSVSEKIFILK